MIYLAHSLLFKIKLFASLVFVFNTAESILEGKKYYLFRVV